MPFAQSDHPSPIVMAFSLCFLVISVVIHEICHGVVADWCGDSTAKDMGRLTLNPLPHIDPFMTLILPATLYFVSGGKVMFGGAKPVPVNMGRLRHPMRDMMLVALAGPVSNFLLATVFCLGWKASVYLGPYHPAHYDSTGEWVEGDLLPAVMYQAMYFNLLLSAFNLLPIPPLDGSRVMTWLLPPQMRPSYMALERFGLILVMGVMWFVPQVQELVLNTMGQMNRFIDIATGGIW